MKSIADFSVIGGGVCAAKGFTAAGIHSGIRANKQKHDLALILSKETCSAAAVYTQNKVKGAPLTVTRQNIADGAAQGILVNSGNANTCCPGGLQLAQDCCALAAKATGLSPQDFIIASTGVIGQEMPIAPFEKGIPLLAAAQSTAGGDDAAFAIMTTDTVPKQIAVEFTLDGKCCRIGGMCKGSGMIHINMATMLAFVTTDAAISPAMLRQALLHSVAFSLNQVSIDGDTSTNDMACILANGLAQNATINAAGPAYDAFCEALGAVLCWMGQQLAADGEGATKLLKCTVSGAVDNAAARSVAKSVISSSLFKAAMFGADANWGRCLCAIGYTPGDFSVDNISLTLQSAAGQVKVCEHSAYHPYSEESAAKVLAEKEIDILIDLGTGKGCGVAWGCDLTYDYVKINGDYRS